MVSPQEAKERQAALMMLASDMIRSNQRQGNTQAKLSEEVVEEIKQIAESTIDFSNPQVFESVKQELESLILK